MTENKVTSDVTGEVIKWGALGLFGLIGIRLISEGLEKGFSDLTNTITAPFQAVGTSLGNIGGTVTDAITNVDETIEDSVDTVKDTVKNTVNVVVRTVDNLKSTKKVLDYASSKDYKNLGKPATVFKVINNSGATASKVTKDIMKAVDIGIVWDAYEQAKQAKMAIQTVVYRSGRNGR